MISLYPEQRRSLTDKKCLIISLIVIIIFYAALTYRLEKIDLDKVSRIKNSDGKF